MALPSSTPKICVLLTFFLAMEIMARATLDQDIELIWGGFISGDGETVTLSLDKTSGSGFQSKDTYLYARVDIDIKLVAGNSAGTVATVYMMSEGPWDIHDEIDLEFLGNVTGEPYTLHTNVFANGVGGREQQFRLWFDPTADFHTYSIVWNPKHIIILVDGGPVRDFKNWVAEGVGFPTWQPMRVFGTLWDAEDWATQGGRVKTDWSQAPFVAYYRNFKAAACVPSPGVSWCGAEPPESSLFDQEMDSPAQWTMQWLRDNFMIYDYCQDSKRFADSGFPTECSLP